ncbi:hypothetical protein EBQ93_04665 [bacterium]|nr:hypothetical protein [bacterium]
MKKMFTLFIICFLAQVTFASESLERFRKERNSLQEKFKAIQYKIAEEFGGLSREALIADPVLARRLQQYDELKDKETILRERLNFLQNEIEELKGEQKLASLHQDAALLSSLRKESHTSSFSLSPAMAASSSSSSSSSSGLASAGSKIGCDKEGERKEDESIGHRSSKGLISSLIMAARLIFSSTLSADLASAGSKRGRDEKEERKEDESLGYRSSKRLISSSVAAASLSSSSSSSAATSLSSQSAAIASINVETPRQKFDRLHEELYIAVLNGADVTNPKIRFIITEIHKLGLKKKGTNLFPLEKARLVAINRITANNSRTTGQLSDKDMRPYRELRDRAGHVLEALRGYAPAQSLVKALGSSSSSAVAASVIPSAVAVISSSSSAALPIDKYTTSKHTLFKNLHKELHAVVVNGADVTNPRVLDLIRRIQATGVRRIGEEQFELEIELTLSNNAIRNYLSGVPNKAITGIIQNRDRVAAVLQALQGPVAPASASASALHAGRLSASAASSSSSSSSRAVRRRGIAGFKRERDEKEEKEDESDQRDALDLFDRAHEFPDGSLSKSKRATRYYKDLKRDGDRA